MTRDYDTDRSRDEEIQGAPPASSTAEQQEKRLAERVDVNRYFLLHARQLEIMLLSATDLSSLLEVLLVSMPRHFSYQAAELWLYDPEKLLGDLVVGGVRYGQHLQLRDEVFSMQELYDIEPDIVLIDPTDSRMFEVLKTDHGIDHALLMPLMSAGKMIGSLHCGNCDVALLSGPAEGDLLAHLAALISVCLKNAISREEISRLSVLDPLTRMSNQRGFERDISREISRAQRLRQPMTLLKMEIDEFSDLCQQQGDTSSQFVIKKVTQRIISDLRATDSMARLSDSQLAVLVPGCGEVLGRDIAERMRQDVEEFSIDDGRGAVLQVTLSVGLVTWEPDHYPAIDMDKLASQVQEVADKALHLSQSKNGNQVSIARLSALMV